MNYGKNKYVIERYSVGVEERLKKICTHNIEPRIELENVEVSANEDQQEYNITLQINVPSLNVYGLSLRSVLNSNGYNFI